ncbi:type II secretion system protein [Salimicrobium sp. PL1-032A]|uniref:PulJ/GspJ family protein n=1 Tax=Salimicrobium sp. PL1-032A TaxID=3095364 RepID=UPI003260D71E
MTNDNGLTLVEILAAITLFGVVVSVFLSLFSDTLMMSNRVENELDAIHVAERTADMIISDSAVREMVRKEAVFCDEGESKESVLLPESYADYTTGQGEKYNLQLTAHCKEEHETVVTPVTIEVYRYTGGTTRLLTETYRYIQGESAYDE